MKETNRFLSMEDFKLVSFKCIKNELEFIFEKVLKKKPSFYGMKIPIQTKILWSRNWEYPWAITNSEVKANETVLDCGCGGSPLLLLLSKYGCDAYGVDLSIYNISSHLHLYNLFRKLIIDFKIKIKRKNKKNHQTHNNNIKKKISKEPSLLASLKYTLKYLFNYKISLKRANFVDSGFIKDPNKLGYNIKLFQESLANMHFEENFFDKVFCISVIEHLPESIAYKGMKEMARVLKKNGLLIITLDNDGKHANPKLIGKYKELIKASGLELYGESNFKIPDSNDVPGKYNVVGFILKKN